jgi:hypothetical protein
MVPTLVLVTANGGCPDQLTRDGGVGPVVEADAVAAADTVRGAARQATPSRGATLLMSR